MAVVNPVNTMSAHRITETCQIIIPIWFRMALEFFIRKCFVLIWYDHFRNVFSLSTYSDQGGQDEISERVSTIRTLVKERIRDDEMVIKLSDVMAVVNPVNTMSAHRITEICQIIIPIWFRMALEFFIRKCFVLCLFNPSIILE
jgi:Na+/alanine symporter